MENTTRQESKNKPCHCTAGIGTLVIVLAWWRPSWAAIALTVLGAMLLIKDSVGKCCCTLSSKLKEK